MRNSTIVSLAAVTVLLVTGSSLEAQQTIPLFDGTSLDGWTTLDGQPVTKGWEVVDGIIHLNIERGRAGHIVTEQEYGDFELRFEWKNVAGGNSGLKYRVRQFGNKTLGCEYQIIDDNRYRVKLRPKGSTGALYDIYEPNDAKVVNPPGQFNNSRIVVRGNRIEHWLNGKRIVVACVGSAEWNRRIAESKFADIPGFGRNRVGKMMLTDHKSEVWYRNIELTPLAAPEKCQLGCTRGGRRCGVFERLFKLKR
ncbi:MAG: 3-keto-disaccharide hydrolase [Planctomycetota bacterium]|jgi:hypothetical protein